MDEIETTNLPEAETPAEVENEAVTPQLDDDGNPVEDQAEVEDDEEEFELDDLKLKLSKADAEKLRLATLREADYRRKTQSVAEERKAVEAAAANLQAVREADEQEMSARGNLSNINNQLAQYQQVNWQNWKQQARAIDAQNFDRAEMDKYDDAWQQAQALERAQQATLGYIQSKVQERQSKEKLADDAARQEFANLMDQGTPAIKKAIPDWSAATAAKLVETSKSRFGFTSEEMTGIDERIILALDAANKWHEHQAKTKKAQSLAQQTEVQPAAKPGTSKAPTAKLDDRLGTEEWMRQRNAETRRRA